MNSVYGQKINILIFTIILLMALFLRFYKISDLPPSLNWDEVSLGYNSYSVLKTGKDEWGKFLPLSFRAFGDYKLPLYVYLDVPFIAALGLNEIAVRLPSALAGVGIVILVFLIVKELTGDIFLAFWGMFMAAIIPWLVLFSRIALEANLALFLTALSFYLFLISARKKGFLILSATLLGLSVFAYNSSRILILPHLLLLVILFPTLCSLKKKEVLISLIILSLFIGIAFLQAFTVDSEARYRWTKILDEGAILEINKLRGASDLPYLLNQLLFNKATYFMVKASQNYLSHFDPKFLFLEGGSNYQFSVPGAGQLYLVMLPLVFVGVWQLLLQKKNWQLFILGWLLIAPIPAAITRDSPHSLRAIFLAIPMLLCAAQGLKWVKDSLPWKIFLPLTTLVLVVLIGETFLFWQKYAGYYRRDYSWSWQYGYKQAVEFVKKNQASYDQIVVTKKYGEPHIFLLFYLQYDPNKYQTNQSLIRYQQSDWFWVDGFDKFEFINDWEMLGNVKCQMSNVKCLIITSPGNYPQGSTLLETINFLDGKRAFDIVAVK